MENKHLHIGTGAICLDRLRRGASDRNNDDNHARSDHNGTCRARGSCDSSSAGGASRGGNSLTWTGLYLERRLLALEWRGLRVGAGRLGQAAQGQRRCGGRRPLGSPVYRVAGYGSPVTGGKLKWLVMGNRRPVISKIHRSPISRLCAIYFDHSSPIHFSRNLSASKGRAIFAVVLGIVGCGPWSDSRARVADLFPATLDDLSSASLRRDLPACASPEWRQRSPTRGPRGNRPLTTYRRANSGRNVFGLPSVGAGSART